MMQKLINRIVTIILFVVLVVLNVLVVLFTSEWWITSMGIFSALNACFAIWQCYRSAIRIAKALDKPTKVTVTIEKRPESDTPQIFLDTEPISLN